MTIVHLSNSATNRSWCGMVPASGCDKADASQPHRECRSCSYAREIATRKAEEQEVLKAWGMRSKNDVLGKCPRCGKLVAMIFPLHDCTPPKKRRK